MSVVQRIARVREIGCGGSGIVYEVWDHERNRRAAFKALNPSLLRNPTTLRRFEREGEILAKLDHPCIVKSFGMTHVDEQYGLLLEYIDGHPLSEVLQSGPMSPTDALRILEQVLDALAACHRLGIVHCDVKPSNILLSRSGQVFLTDFGISRLHESTAQSSPAAPTTTGPLWGTPEYCPPEAWEGKAISPRWDVYAAGILLYECVTGERAFASQPLPVLIRTVLMEGVPPISAKGTGASEPLSWLVDRMIARDPAHRPEDAADALAMLRRVPEYGRSGQNDTIPLRPDSSAEVIPSLPPVPPSKVRLGRVRHAHLFLLFLATVTLIVTWQSERTQPGPGTNVEPRADTLSSPTSSAPTASSAQADVPADPENLVVNAEYVFFSAFDPEHGRELWCSSPYERAPARVVDLAPGAASSDPKDLFTRRYGGLYFSAVTPEYGRELWICETPGDGRLYVRQVRDILTGPAGSDPVPLCNHETLTLFSAVTYKEGRELWFSNSHGSQTALLGDLFPGSLGSNTMSLRAVTIGDQIMLPVIRDHVHGTMFMAYNLAELRETFLGDVADDFDFPIACNGVVLFSQSRADTGNELWRFDPATNTIELVADIRPGPDSSHPGQFHMWQGRVYFQARTEAEGQELWVTDGTEAGTWLMADINPGPADSDPSGFAGGDGLLYFRATQEATGRELWVTDGTRESTSLLADINKGRTGSEPYNLTAMNKALYVTANDGTHGEELWRVEVREDGVDARLIADFFPGLDGSEPHQLVWANPSRGVLAATHPVYGRTVFEFDSKGNEFKVPELD